MTDEARRSLEASRAASPRAAEFVSSIARALVRAPSARLAQGLVTHIDRTPIELDLALAQWTAYRRALDDNGWTTIEVAEAPACPDGVFVEDAAVVAGNAALLCRPGAESRRPEVASVAAALRELGYELGSVEAPGTLDGGDVLEVGTTMYIGLGGRTNTAGIAAARDFFAPRGFTVVVVPNTKVLHLKSAVTALPDGRVIGYEPVTQDPSVFGSFLAMPEESGAHVVDLGNSRLLMAAGCPASVELIASLGYEPVVVDISEYEKLEGCVTCLSIRLPATTELGTES